METPLQKRKRELRARAREALAQLTDDYRRLASAQICARLTAHTIWQQARSILFYAPKREEADIWPLLDAAGQGGKMILLPRFVAATGSYVACRVENCQQDVTTGAFGIREPNAACPEVSLGTPDLILVPGLAFDAAGRRLGRGRGFYDRILAAAGGTTCGVAFEVQILDEIPTGPHDMRLDHVLTPTRWLEAATRPY